MTWWRQWRAWVEAQRAESERQLELSIMTVIDGDQSTLYKASDVVELVRRHDKEAL